MCTLAAYVRVSAEIPLVVAANRDELLDRPTAAPAALAVDPWIFAGQDLQAGGTWFGVNEHGLVAGILNRRGAALSDPTRRSRGLLCLEVLQTASMRAAAEYVGRAAGADYNGFNLLVADRRQAFVATNPGGTVRITPLPRGVHLLTNLDLNDPTCPRIAKSSEQFRALSLPPAAAVESLVPSLTSLLADHTTALDPRAATIDTLCVHLPGYGTRSSSIVAVAADGTLRFWYADGPPCRTRFAELVLPS